MCSKLKRILRHKVAYRYKIDIYTFQIEDVAKVAKTGIDVNWANSPLTELLV